MNLPPLRLYNTFARTKEVLQPLNHGVVRLYSCGPTVYRYVHVGNLRTFMLPDLLCRSLEYLGYTTERVMNIPDVGHLTDDTFDRGEDRRLAAARLENRSTEEIAAHYTEAFRDDVRKVNIRPAANYPRATDYIPRMLELVEKLIELGHAYEVEGTVYYDIASFPAYGRLSRNTTRQLLAGTRGDPDPRKRSPGDFTLWKAAREKRLQVWDSPWGPGFPGWHIECSAMSTALLGERFDVHTGGADNVFPHHEAEIAQSEGAFGHPVVSCWVHGEHLLLSGARMAKSAGGRGRTPGTPRTCACGARLRRLRPVAGPARGARRAGQRRARWPALEGAAGLVRAGNAATSLRVPTWTQWIILHQPRFDGRA